jgi:riboflavin kinase/FMN adenylyltransferase
MRIVREWRGLSQDDRGASIALGNFDGVHRGHQAVIGLAAAAARDQGLPLGVVSFEPHPRRIFQPDAPAFRLMKPEQLARALDALGVDLLYLLPFDEVMRELSDEAFAEQVLHQGLGVRHVAVGFDMRNALREGRPELAAGILGRPFAIEGEVRHGRQLGRTLGYPTANVELDDYVAPRFGVYATRTRLSDGRTLAGVANIGVNPTVAGEIAPRLEVWLFDFDEDLYGQVIETDLIAFLRPEAKFASLEDMTAQIDDDASMARMILSAV